jgi:hypothetical protein
MEKRVFCVALALMVCAIRVSAETITVRLPALEERFMTYETLTATFDLGTSPAFIGQARIRFKGTFYPGKAYFWSDPPELWFYYGDSTWSIMDPPESQGDWETTSEYFDTFRSFIDESKFSWHGQGAPSWVFLLDGQGQVDTRLHGVMPISWVVLEEAKAYINEAHLIIEEEIRLTSPNGDEVLQAGTTHTIQWTDFRSGGCSRAYDLQYSTDNGLTWTPLGSATNECSHDWLVPEIDSNDCLVRVFDANNAGIYDTSNGPFTIYRCTLNYDLTGDCFVDFTDFAALASEWLKCGNPFDPNCVN